MWLELAHRFAVIVLSVAIATGVMAHAAQSQAHHGQVTVTVASDHLTTATLDGCTGNQKIKVQITCLAICAGVGDLPPLAAVFNSVDARTLNPAVDLVVIDDIIPPDPYPPKSYA